MARRLEAALRRVLLSGAWRGVAARLLAGYVRLVHATTRWQVVGREGFDALAARPGGFLGAIWHGRLFVSPTVDPSGKRPVAMISNARDGELIAAVVARFGISAVRGSTYDRAKRRDKGGSAAFREAERELAAGSVLAITPDGPRGPRMRAHAGVAELSAAAGAPVVCIAFSTARGLFLRSWDRFLLPLPFDRGVILYGEPLEPPAPGGVEAHRAAIEAALNALTERADRLCGRAPVVPEAPLPQGASAAAG